MKKPEINIDKAFDALQMEMEEWFVAIVTNLPNFVVAFFIIILFIFLSKYTRKISHKVTDKLTNSKSVSTLITNIISFSFFTTGIIIALGVMQLDGTVKSLLAGAGIIGLALGFAFQDIIVNLFSGIVIAINEPVHDGDLVESNGVYGYVKAIKLRAVFINNLEGQTVIIPCRDIIQKPLRNFTSEGIRRVDVPVGISYGEDLDFVKKVTTEAIKDIPFMDKKSGIEFYYSGFENSSIDFVIRFWLSKVDEKIYLQAKSDAIMQIKAAYNENDITIPFPIRTLDFGIKGGEKLSAMLKNVKSEKE